jgi:hypothetical protein
LADLRWPFRERLSAANLGSCNGEREARAGGSAVPQFLFEEERFFAFLRNAREVEADGPVRVSFVMPAITGLRFGCGHSPVKKQRRRKCLTTQRSSQSHGGEESREIAYSAEEFCVRNDRDLTLLS